MGEGGDSGVGSPLQIFCKADTLYFSLWQFVNAYIFLTILCIILDYINKTK